MRSVWHREPVTAHSVPDVATHYFVAGRPPFLNLSDLPEDELSLAIAALGREHAEGKSQRTFGRRYMDLRRQTEARLRELFAASGGEMQRSAPHYFVLGTSAWFEALSPDMRSVSVSLDDLPKRSTSVTYPDSVVAMRCGAAFGLPDVAKPYHDRVFTLDELPDLIAQYGLPDDEADENYQGYEFREFEKFIEVQVWSDEVLDLVKERRL